MRANIQSAFLDPSARDHKIRSTKIVAELGQVLIDTLAGQVECVGSLRSKLVVGEGAAPSRHANLRLPGFIRPRCTAGATHRLAESYEGFKTHTRKVLGLRPRCHP
jgi:hypothetical protein